jgi:hypothetical protein
MARPQAAQVEKAGSSLRPPPLTTRNSAASQSVWPARARGGVQKAGAPHLVQGGGRAKGRTLHNRGGLEGFSTLRRVVRGPERGSEAERLQGPGANGGRSDVQQRFLGTPRSCSEPVTHAAGAAKGSICEGRHAVSYRDGTTSIKPAIFSKFGSPVSAVANLANLTLGRRSRVPEFHPQRARLLPINLPASLPLLL